MRSRKRRNRPSPHDITFTTFTRNAVQHHRHALFMPVIYADILPYIFVLPHLFILQSPMHLDPTRLNSWNGIGRIKAACYTQYITKDSVGPGEVVLDAADQPTLLLLGQIGHECALSTSNRLSPSLYLCPHTPTFQYLAAHLTTDFSAAEREKNIPKPPSAAGKRDATRLELEADNKPPPHMKGLSYSPARRSRGQMTT
ncbi:hypothetical protein HBH95_179330 [Parastagonospora nodorum]|nr:hypothetical protein HBH95_179330 [Parastagonospora nodorum]